MATITANKNLNHVLIIILVVFILCYIGYQSHLDSSINSEKENILTTEINDLSKTYYSKRFNLSIDTRRNNGTITNREFAEIQTIYQNYKTFQSFGH